MKDTQKIWRRSLALLIAFLLCWPAIPWKNVQASEFKMKSDMYWNEEFEMLLPPQQNAGCYRLEGTNLSISDENGNRIEPNMEIQSNSMIKIRADQEMDEEGTKTKLEIRFLSAEQDEIFRREYGIKVLPVPVKVAWEEGILDRFYNGEREAVTLAQPRILFAGEGAYVLPEALALENTEFVFELSSKDAGNRQAILRDPVSLKLNDSEHFRLIESVPNLQVNIQRIMLDESNVTVKEVSGKYYDGTSNAVVSAELNNQNQRIVDNEFSNVELSFKADYWNGEREESGDAEQEMIVPNVALSKLKVMEGGTESPNYCFSDNTTIYVEGLFEITPNDSFLKFTGMKSLGTAVTERWENGDMLDIHWLQKNTEIKNKDFWFSEDPTAAWEEVYCADSKEPVRLYAKNHLGLVSRPIFVAVDGTAPAGTILAKVGGEKALPISELIDEYHILSKGNKIFVIFEGVDTDSKISKIEWYGSDVPLAEDEKQLKEQWKMLAPEKIQTVQINEHVEKSSNISELVLEHIEEKEALKRFYYARITDFAGNVSYVSSAGVLQDCSKPMIEVEMPVAETVVGEERRNVYSENIEITFDVKEEGISSGIAGVRVELLDHCGTLMQSYSIGAYEKDEASNKSVWSDDSQKRITAIEILEKTAYPTDVQINESKNGTLKAIFDDLEDGSYTVTIQAVDKVGNECEIVSESFIKDSKAPELCVGKTEEEPKERLDEILEFHSERTANNFYTGGKITFTVSDMTPLTELKLTVNGMEIPEMNWKVSQEGADGCLRRSIVLAFGEEQSFLEGKYKVVLWATDSLNRTTKKVIEEFVIDYTAPTYLVEFSEVDERSYKDDPGILYYNDSIEAKFLIKEESGYDETQMMFVVKNAKGNEVFRWKQDYEIQNENFIFQHEKDSKEYRLVIPDLEENNDDGYTFVIEGKDQGGNQLKPAVGSEENPAVDYEKELRMIRVMDVTAPVLKKVDYDTKEKFKTVQKKDYVNEETNITFIIEEHHPKDNKSLVSGDYEEKVNQWTSEEGQRDIYATNLFVPMKGTGGDEQIVQLEIIDKAGNRAQPEKDEEGNAVNYRSIDNTRLEHGTYIDRFTVDTVPPQIKLEYVDHNPAPNRKNEEGIDYFNHPITVRLTVNEHNFDEKLLDEYIGLKNEKAKPVQSEWKADGDIHVKTFQYEADNQYDLTIKGTDNAGNPLVLRGEDEKMSVTTNREGIGVKTAVDRKIPVYGDTGKPAIVIVPKAEEGKNLSGQPLYTTDVTYEVSVYDPLNPSKKGYASGIYEVHITAEGEDGTVAVCTIDRNGMISCDDGISVKKIKGNLSSRGKGADEKYVYRVTILKKAFNTNEITLKVKAEDVATNVNEQIVGSIGIDRTSPKVTIRYDEKEVSNEKYFHETRTAIITVLERNFQKDCLQFLVNGREQSLDFKMIYDGEGNHDNRKWIATYTFTEENDYKLEVYCKDLAGNRGTVSYEGDAPQVFTIDWTKPTIAVTFDNYHAFQENYYDAKRVATVTIIEKNFDERDVQILGDAFDGENPVTYPKITNWSSSGDVHTANITYAADAHYTLDVTYADLAMNKAEEFNKIEFVVDTKNPEVMIHGVEHKNAYAKDVFPRIQFSDNHYDRYEVKMTRIERENTETDLTEQMVGKIPVSMDETGKGVGIKQLVNPEFVKENDGIYTLTVTVYDKAGRFTEKQVIYSVNRFGTVYVYSEDLAALIGGYHQKVEGDLYVKAYNPNCLRENSVKLEICCDGSNMETQKSSANMAEAMLPYDGGWFEYQFYLEPADFEKDGRYTVLISDEDEVGNIKTNSEAPIEFYVDAAKPVLERITGLEHARVRANEIHVAYSVSDSIGLESVSVFVNDRLVDQRKGLESSMVFQSSFVIGTGMDQKIRFVVKDRAGNVFDTAKDEFNPVYEFHSEITVSSNRFILWYANKQLFWGTLAAVAGMIGGGILFFIIKKKKDLERKANDN